MQTQTPATTAPAAAPRPARRKVRATTGALIARALDARAKRAPEQSARPFPTFTASLESQPIIRGPRELAALVRGIATEPAECLVLVCLDTRNRVRSLEVIHRGGVNQSIAEPRSMFRAAILADAAAIAIAHNHPSGDPAPSPEDMQVTKRVKECGELLGIPLLDHLIIGAPRGEGAEPEHRSLKEAGLL